MHVACRITAIDPRQSGMKEKYHGKSEERSQRQRPGGQKRMVVIMSTFYQQKILELSKNYLPNRLTYVDPSVDDANENFSEYCFAFQVFTEI